MQLYKTKTIKTNHFFSSRHEGVSKDPFNSLNLAYHVGDSPASVMTNHKLLASYSGYNLRKLVFMDQIHSNKVVVVDEELFEVPSCDALVTNMYDTPLMIMSADCAPVLFEDNVKGVVAVAHVGRAGAFGDIITNVIVTMQERFCSQSEDIKVAIGPRIGVCCYEVGDKELNEARSLGYDFACKINHLDIDAIISYQLDKNGILEENREFLDICTKCSNSEFFSYRAEQRTGRQVGVIWI
ncbi:MAG: peptidoglycan editing factor PgeF [Epsilonproteobacteria bacterium]|nr:peptidoglycan editing factor PgeF [Campylobacterota bacterium]